MVGVPLPGTAAPATSTDPCTQGPRSLWVDRTHDWLSRGLCWPSRWVDGFFADPLSTSNEPAASLVRITGERTWRDDGLDDRDLDVDARVWLPSAERRLSLLFRSNEDDTVADGPQASEVTGIGEDDSGFRGALRWVINRTEAMDLDLDTSIDMGCRWEDGSMDRGGMDHGQRGGGDVDGDGLTSILSPPYFLSLSYLCPPSFLPPRSRSTLSADSRSVSRRSSLASPAVSEPHGKRCPSSRCSTARSR